MNRRILLLTPFSFLIAPVLSAQREPPLPEQPVPVTQAPANKGTPEQTLLARPNAENQRLYGSSDSLINADAAQAVSDKFRAEYGQAASPRIVIHVNRALVNPNSGLRLTGRTEKYYESTSQKKGEEPTTSSDKSGENTYSAGEAPKEATLADQQTVREIERLFGRVFRHAGAKLADQRAAAALLDDQPNTKIGSDQSAKEREALKQIADIAIEVLISSRELKVTGVSGDSTLMVPDIQATAVRLSDSTILGQAAASDILGQSAAAGGLARRFGPADVTEATAFALMEDMLIGAK
jgi:hypothetical protein